MTAQLPLSNGTVSVPALAFTSDSDTGWYRIGANEIGLALGGAKVVDFSASGVAVTGTISASGATGLSDGTVGTPGLNFTSDTDSGVYRIGANNLGVAVNGAKVLDVATTGLGITGTLTTTSTIELGNASDTTVARVSAGVISVEGSNVLMASNIAAQSDMETATSTSLLVTAGRAQYHPGSAKAHVCFNGTGTIATFESYNISSITDGGVGTYTLNFSTAFSDGSYAAGGTSTTTGGVLGGICAQNSGTKSASAFDITARTNAGAVDSTPIGMSIHGDQ